MKVKIEVTLTKKMKDAYIKTGGTMCPFCGKDTLEGDAVEIDAGFATQNITCLSCEGEWTDHYRLYDMTE